MKHVLVEITDHASRDQIVLDVEHDDNLALALSSMIDDLQLVHRWISGGMTIAQCRNRLVEEHDARGMVRL